MLGPVHSFGYNMGLYHGLVPSSKDIRAITVFGDVMNWHKLRMLGPVHSFGYNMGLYHGLVPSSKDIRAITVFGYVMNWHKLRMLGPVHSFGYNIWDYTMAWYTALKDNIQSPGTQLKRCQSYFNVSLCHRLASTAHACTGL